MEHVWRKIDGLRADFELLKEDRTPIDVFTIFEVDHPTAAEKDYNLSVSTYFEAQDNREVVDIAELNAEPKTTVAKIDRLRADIDAIVAEIEGEEVEA